MQADDMTLELFEGFSLAVRQGVRNGIAVAALKYGDVPDSIIIKIMGAVILDMIHAVSEDATEYSRTIKEFCKFLEFGLERTTMTDKDGIVQYMDTGKQ